MQLAARGCFDRAIIAIIAGFANRGRSGAAISTMPAGSDQRYDHMIANGKA